MLSLLFCIILFVFLNILVDGEKHWESLFDLSQKKEEKTSQESSGEEEEEEEEDQ